MSHRTFTDALEQFEGKFACIRHHDIFYISLLPSARDFSMNHVNSYPFHYLSAQTVVLVFFTCNNNCMSYTFAFSMCTVLNCCTLLNLAYSKYAIFSYSSKSKNVHILAIGQNNLAVIMSRNTAFISKSMTHYSP